MRKIIYIDDERMNLDLFSINFRKDYQVFKTLYPKESFNIIKKEQIKVIITDYKMPEMNGMELINAVKETYPETVCMILSAYVESEVITDKSKVFKYIMKPYKRDELAQHIEEAFKEIKE